MLAQLRPPNPVKSVEELAGCGQSLEFLGILATERKWHRPRIVAAPFEGEAVLLHGLVVEASAHDSYV